jgi:hypothetical protein
MPWRREDNIKLDLTRSYFFTAVTAFNFQAIGLFLRRLGGLPADANNVGY